MVSSLQNQFQAAMLNAYQQGRHLAGMDSQYEEIFWQNRCRLNKLIHWIFYIDS